MLREPWTCSEVYVLALQWSAHWPEDEEHLWFLFCVEKGFCVLSSYTISLAFHIVASFKRNNSRYLFGESCSYYCIYLHQEYWKCLYNYIGLEFITIKILSTYYYLYTLYEGCIFSFFHLIYTMEQVWSRYVLDNNPSKYLENYIYRINTFAVHNCMMMWKYMISSKYTNSNSPFLIQIDGLMEWLNDPVKCLYPISFLPCKISQRLLFARKYIFAFHENCQRLCHMGLLSFGSSNNKEKDQVSMSCLWYTV